MTTRPRTPTGRPRGRPPYTPEQRAQRDRDVEARRDAEVAANAARVAAQREGRISKRLLVDDEQEARLERLVEAMGHAGVSDLVDALIRNAPEPEGDD